MRGIRNFLAILITIFLAVPLLLGITWAVGITKAVISPEFISEVPRELADEIPSVIDDLVVAARENDHSIDEGSRIWLMALSRADKTFAQMLLDTGISSWVENDMSGALEQVANMLRGDIPFRNIYLSMNGLKLALAGDVMQSYMLSVIKNLPECSEAELSQWQDFINDPSFSGSLPPCRPAAGITPQAVAAIQKRMVEDIPEKIELVEGIDRFHRSFDVARTVESVTFFLFLIPALFILLAAGLGATSKSSFFRWSGIITMTGGGISLLMALGIRNMTPWSGTGFPNIFTEFTPLTHLHEIAIARISDAGTIILSHLLDPVIQVAGGVCVVGLVIFALAYAFTTAPAASGTRTRSQD